MTWAVYDDQRRVLRLDNSQTAPEGPGVEKLVSPAASWPAEPSNGFVLYCRGGNLEWEDARDLAAQRVAKWNDIKAERERRIAAPKQTSVGTFDADPEATANLANVIALTQIAVARGLPGTARYTLADNTRPTLTLEQLQTAALEMGAQVQALYDEGETLRAAKDAATTAEDLAKVYWPPA